ncbi:MAG TPA: hypothetical protein VLI55_15810 [Bryobacteraceae bacterium]|nr:hypothetical protein [Bryobacteraceae bacterium]
MPSLTTVVFRKQIVTANRLPTPVAELANARAATLNQNDQQNDTHDTGDYADES